MATVIYVSAYRIGRHVQGDAAADPITVEQDDGITFHADAIEIDGPCVVRYMPDAPNPAGARCWIETDAPVRAIGHARADTVAYRFVGNASGLVGAAGAAADALRSVERAADKALETLGALAQGEHPKEAP